jgi:uncharacterized membrane protein YGL010W
MNKSKSVFQWSVLSHLYFCVEDYLPACHVNASDLFYLSSRYISLFRRVPSFERLFGGLTNFDMMEQLASYGAYHSHPINQLIHVIFVPVIIFTMMVFVSQIPPVWNVSPEGYMGRFISALVGNDGCYFDPSFLVFAAYAFYYVALDVKVGSSAALYLYLLYRAVEPFKRAMIAAGVARPWSVALGLHIFAWYMQIHPGHAIFEKRKPALLDSFAQSIMMAPLFVWYEVLFFLGYNKEFKKRLDMKVEENKALAGFGKASHKDEKLS